MVTRPQRAERGGEGAIEFHKGKKTNGENASTWPQRSFLIDGVAA